jgi:hypothetical protein
LQAGLDSQTLTAFGAASVDDSAAATGFHADQKAVGTCAAGLGGLVSAFHGQFSINNSKVFRAIRVFGET